MEIRQLEYFEEVARRRNFTKAASALHVSQPTITTSIKNLEEELEIPLFVRDKRSVTLTYEGEIFRKKSSEVMEAFRQMISDMEHLTGEQEWTVNIGLTPIAGSFLNTLFYRDFASRYPQVKFKVLELGSIGLLAAVDADEIDIGYLVLQEGMEEQYDICPIQEGILLALIHSDNPLSRKAFIELEELMDEPLVNIPPHSYIRNKLDSEFQKRGIVPKVLAEPQQMITSFHLVENNVGICFALGNGYASMIQNEHVVPVPVRPEIPYRAGFVWKKGKKLTRAAKNCIEYVKNYTEEQMGS